MECGCHIEVKRGFHVTVVDCECHRWRPSTSVVDYDVQTTERRERLLEQSVQLGRIRHICGHGEGATTALSHLRGNFFQRLRTTRRNDDIGTCLCERDARRTADSAPAARHDGDL